MSEKKLLEEGTIRRFMQLANIRPINEGEASTHTRSPSDGPFANAGSRTFATAGRTEVNLREVEKKKAVKPVGKKKPEELEEAYVDEAAEMEEGLENEGDTVQEAYGEMSEEETGGMEGGDSEQTPTEKLASGLVELVNQFLEEEGSSKRVETEEEEEEEEELEEPMDDEEGGEAEAGGPPEGLEEPMMEVMDEDQLAEELTRRVAARLVQEMKARKLREGTLNGGSEKVKGKKINGPDAPVHGSEKEWLAKPAHHKAPTKGKGSPVGKVGTPYTKAAVPSKSAGHKRNNLGPSGALTTHGKK